MNRSIRCPSWLLLVVACLCVFVPPAVGQGDARERPAGSGLGATLVGSLEEGTTGRLAVKWDGPSGALLDVWVDLNGDGVLASCELVAEGRPLKSGIEVVSFELPLGVPVASDAPVWVRARGRGWCDGVATVAGTKAGDLCAWQPGFEYCRLEGPVRAMTVWDDGSGPALYVGGEFPTISGVTVNNIARWDGNAWSALSGPSGTGVGSHPYLPTVAALAVYDDGTGPALYVGGYFETAGGVTANNVARWDGGEWSALGTGVGSSWTSPGVLALAVYDDGTGPALYAGGQFDTAGGVTVNCIARWDSTAWSALSGPSGTGISGGDAVRALVVFDDGRGPALYAGGLFGYAGGVWVNCIARWDGSAWSALGGSPGKGVDGGVNTLAVFDDGCGLGLYVGGQFDTAGGVVVNNIARWDGNAWFALGVPPGMGDVYWVLAMAVYDDGTGPALYAGGQFDTAGGITVNNVARWNGSVWAVLSGPSGIGIMGNVNALAIFDDGSGPSLYVGGWFAAAGGVPADHIAQWDGGEWSALTSSSAAGVSGPVFALTVFDDGTGPALYAGGWFGSAGDVAVGSIARWDGTAWSPLVGPSGMGVDGWVDALAVYDDGTGPALYAGGSFPSIGTLAVNNIARWDGSSWAPLGWYGSEGVSGEVLALAVYDDGTGPALYVGGGFLTAGWSTTVNGIARWDGGTWSALAGPAGTGMDGEVHALAVYDHGSGAALYAGGAFETAGGVTVNSVARWNGSVWSDLSGGVYLYGLRPGSVDALAVFDDGTGSALFAGGLFDLAGSVWAWSIARWDGGEWSDLDGGVSGFWSWWVASLAVHDDGTGPALYAGGTFSVAGSAEALNIARWDGSAWSSLETGVGYYDTTAVLALSPFDDGSGKALYAGGDFTIAGGLPSGNIAAWKCPAGLVFSDSFESGDTSAWSTVVP